MLGGVEPVNWAYITRSGVSQAPASPLSSGPLTNPNFAELNPDSTRDLLMNPGDRIRMHMHDTPAGFRVDMTDLTTGQTGSRPASVANGFGHILYTPNSTTSQEAPYAFHPEDSTGIPRGNTWSAQHPAWFHSVRANPDVAVTVDGERRSMHARVARSVSARGSIVCDHCSGYAAYQARTGGRVIPIVVLEPRVGPSSCRDAQGHRPPGAGRGPPRTRAR